VVRDEALCAIVLVEPSLVRAQVNARRLAAEPLQPEPRPRSRSTPGSRCAATLPKHSPARPARQVLDLLKHEVGEPNVPAPAWSRIADRHADVVRGFARSPPPWDRSSHAREHALLSGNAIRPCRFPFQSAFSRQSARKSQPGRRPRARTCPLRRVIPRRYPLVEVDLRHGALSRSPGASSICLAAQVPTLPSQRLMLECAPHARLEVGLRLDAISERSLKEMYQEVIDHLEGLGHVGAPSDAGSNS